MVLVLLGLAMMIIGYIGVFFARLIKSAVSRQREFLADASAVQFTRNPSGLSGALKKIGGLATGSRLATPAAETASHLFFANGIASPFLGLLATHPPLTERIRRLDPQFTGDLASPAPASHTAAGTAATTGTSPLSALSALTPPPLPGMSPAQAVNHAGTLSAVSLLQAAHSIEAIPPSLRTAAHTPALAQAVIFGILLDSRPEPRRQQLAYLAKRVPAELNDAIQTLDRELTALPAPLRQPLVEIAIGTLKHLLPAEYPAFRETVMGLVSADEEVSLFEYMVLRMLLRHLDTPFGLAKRARIHITSLNTLTHEAATVLSALAWFGATTPEMATAAFAAGCRELGVNTLTLLPTEAASLKEMDQALDRLAETTPPIKQKLVAACTAAISADGVVTLEEGEALRAVADALDCPLPRG